MSHPYNHTTAGAHRRVADARAGWLPARIDPASPGATVRAGEARAYLFTLARELRLWLDEVDTAAAAIDEIARYAKPGQAA